MSKIRLRISLLAMSLILAVSMNAYAYDFFGHDIAAVFVANADECNAACNNNAACQAWTMVKAPLKHPTRDVCFLKDTFSEPVLNSVCTSNAVCLSGIKRSDGWCGESPARSAGGSDVLGQNVVLSCPANQSCGPILIPGGEQVCWFLFIPYPCHGPTLQTTEFFCQ